MKRRLVCVILLAALGAGCSGGERVSPNPQWRCFCIRADGTVDSLSAHSMMTQNGDAREAEFTIKVIRDGQEDVWRQVGAAYNVSIVTSREGKCGQP